MKYKKFKLREGKEAQWRRWCDFLIAHRDEVFKTMKEEAVTREACFLKDNIVYYGMEGLCLPSSDCQINIDHRRHRRECFDLPGEFVENVPEESEVLFDFKQI